MRIQDLTLGLLPVSRFTGQQTAKRKLRWRNRQTIFAGGYFRGKIFSREDIFARRYFRRKIFSREDIFARRYFRGKIFSREDIFAWTVYSRKYLLAKIFQIHFSRNFLPAKIKCYTVLRQEDERNAAIQGTIPTQYKTTRDRWNSEIPYTKHHGYATSVYRSLYYFLHCDDLETNMTIGVGVLVCIIYKQLCYIVE